MKGLIKIKTTEARTDNGRASVRSRLRGFVIDFLIMNLGVLCMSVGVYFFKMTNGFSTGGVSGIAIAVSTLTGGVISAATLMLALNILLLVIGFIFLGKGVGGKTAFCSLMFSAETWLFERLIPLNAPLTDDAFLELVYAMLLTAIGSSLLFARSASSGGTDITAMILKKYTSIDIGKALLATDALIACSAFFTYGIRIGLYSLLGLFVKAFLVDTIIESINLCKSFTIVTEKPDEICAYILGTMHHGVTLLDAVGAYTGAPKKMILTSCRRTEAAKLEKSLRMLDPEAFVTITNSNKIIGRGFHGV